MWADCWINMNNQDFNTSYHNVRMPVIIQQSHQGNKQYPQHGQVPGLRERIHRNGLMIFIYTYIYIIKYNYIYILYIYIYIYIIINIPQSPRNCQPLPATSSCSTTLKSILSLYSPELLMHPASSSLLKKDMLTTCHQNSAPSSHPLSFQTSQYPLVN